MSFACLFCRSFAKFRLVTVSITEISRNLISWYNFGKTMVLLNL